MLMHMKMELNVCKQGSNELPGFRFHPTEQELVGFYLKRMVQGKLRNFNFIPMLDLYRYDPWELSNFANLNEKELFFFVPRDERCQNNRGRPNRMTVSGYWKATGSDRSVHDDNAKCIGLKKTLVFYRGRAPRGLKTDWIMNEYRLPDYFHEPKKEIVLCRIYKKATPLKWLEQQAMNQAEDLDCISHDSPLSPAEIFDDNKRDQETESNCVRNSDSVACHEIRTEPSNYPQDKVTKSNITSSLGCVVDSGLMESTVCGNFIDPEFSSFADDCQKFEGFSSIMALLTSSPSPASSSIECCWENPPMVEEPRSFPIPKLSIDFCDEEAASDGNWNLWMDLSVLHDMNSSLLS